MLCLNQTTLGMAASATAAVTAWCAAWWLTEPVPIPVTSLLPMALLPLAGALTPTQVAESYGSPLILLLMGGFMLSGALARSGAHRRLALAMISHLRPSGSAWTGTRLHAGGGLSVDVDIQYRYHPDAAAGRTGRAVR